MKNDLDDLDEILERTRRVRRAAESTKEDPCIAPGFLSRFPEECRALHHLRVWEWVSYGGAVMALVIALITLWRVEPEDVGEQVSDPWMEMSVTATGEGVAR